VQRASLLLEVTDATSPTGAEQSAQVASVLRELDCGDKPRIHVLNKIDLFDEKERLRRKDSEGSVSISAARGLHLDRLLAAIDARLQDDPIARARLRVPQSEGKALARLEARSVIVSRHYRDAEGQAMVELVVDAPESLMRELRRFVISGGRSSGDVAAVHRRRRRPATQAE